MARHDLKAHIPKELQVKKKRGRKKGVKTRPPYEIYLERLAEQKRRKLNYQGRTKAQQKRITRTYTYNLMGYYKDSPSRVFFEKFIKPLLAIYEVEQPDLDPSQVMEALFDSDNRPIRTFVVDSSIKINGKIREQRVQLPNRDCKPGSLLVVVEYQDRVAQIKADVEHIYPGYDLYHPVVYTLNSREYAEILPFIREIT